MNFMSTKYRLWSLLYRNKVSKNLTVICTLAGKLSHFGFQVNEYANLKRANRV
jgi:hypothetical protein